MQIVSGQVSIRGSIGYSRGVGSRVLLLIDRFPALSADNGEIKLDAIPIDQIASVEIIKGAGSALYGTGALGGIINVITHKPAQQPKTSYKFWASYAQQEYQPDAPVVFSIGTRYDRGKVDGCSAQHNVSPKIGLSWHLTHN